MEIRQLFVSRQDKTKLVNGAAKRKDDGSLELDLQSPVISTVAKSYSHIQGSDKLKGYPKSLIIAKLGSEAALDRAMARGDVKCVNERGRQFYVFNMIEIAKVQGTEQQTQGTLSAQADSGQLAGFTSFVENFQPTFQDNAVGFGDFGENALASTSSMVPHVPDTPGVGGRRSATTTTTTTTTCHL